MKSKNKPLSIDECLSIENQIKTFNLFEYFHKKIYSSNHFSVSDKIISAHRKFLSQINTTHTSLLQDNYFWWKYFLFQFIYWSKLELLDERKVSYTFIIGPKAWERWINRNQDYDFTILSNKVKGQHSISYIDYSNFLIIMDRIKYPNIKTTVPKPTLSESLLRKRFHNTERGLNLCLTSTSLYHPGDKSCILCKQKDTCKIILQNHNSRLFNLRLGAK